jgi:hypothetical protein
MRKLVHKEKLERIDIERKSLVLGKMKKKD